MTRRRAAAFAAVAAAVAGSIFAAGAWVVFTVAEMMDRVERERGAS